MRQKHGNDGHFRLSCFNPGAILSAAVSPSFPPSSPVNLQETLYLFPQLYFFPHDFFPINHCCATLFQYLFLCNKVILSSVCSFKFNHVRVFRFRYLSISLTNFSLFIFVYLLSSFFVYIQHSLFFYPAFDLLYPS